MRQDRICPYCEKVITGRHSNGLHPKCNEKFNREMDEAFGAPPAPVPIKIAAVLMATTNFDDAERVF